MINPVARHSQIRCTESAYRRRTVAVAVFQSVEHRVAAVAERCDEERRRTGRGLPIERGRVRGAGLDEVRPQGHRAVVGDVPVAFGDPVQFVEERLTAAFSLRIATAR